MIETSNIRIMVRGAYDVQQLRIQMGNRMIVAPIIRAKRWAMMRESVGRRSGAHDVANYGI